MSIEAMKQALEHVQEFKRRWFAVPPFGNKVNKATRDAVTLTHVPVFQIEDTLRQAIAEAEKQEPVAWMWKDETITTDPDRADGTWTPLYTHPQPSQKPLTDEQIATISVECATVSPSDIYFARAIEAAHGIKGNT